ncbi:hypothetical protein F5Y19DRAFT_130977 [Xylariaceae sp. FL1651]|nr:hypothetical protein F5Y19DRAFT_130977 [Xylariaceae sp. FL1651]
MAPWSLWSQSPSQPPPPAPKTSSPPSGLTQAPPPAPTPDFRADDAHYEDMPSSSELWQIGAKSLQTGAVTGQRCLPSRLLLTNMSWVGGIGTLVGAGSGIVRSAPPTLFALFAGVQWFALGSSYIASRSLLCHAWGGEENMNSSDMVKASGVAGSVSGMVGGMIRGPRNIIPGMVFFGTLGAASSYVSQRFRPTGSKPKTSWLDSKWSPMQRLSDKDYMEKIEEKILRLDAEIAIIDESIASLKGSLQSPANSTEPMATTK